MTRRTFLPAAAAVPLALAVTRKGRLKQSVCRWCYKDIPLEDLARESARLGLKGMDLIGPDEWPVVKKYGLTPAMTTGGGTMRRGDRSQARSARPAGGLLDRRWIGDV